MDIHTRKIDGSTHIFPGRTVNDREIFPYPYEIYSTQYDEEIDASTESDVFSSHEKRRLMRYSESLPSYDSTKIKSALENLLANSQGVKPRFTFLVDNSGSMRGGNIIHAFQMVHAFGMACEELGIDIEILGNTTSAWKGGKVREKWIENGRDSSPGRLNSLRHIIYMKAGQKFSERGGNLALMLKDGLLKENIDGEALEWAYKRIYDANQPGNILVHMSDGVSMDDSTLSCNPRDFLSSHYNAASTFIHERRDTNLYRINIGNEKSQGIPSSDITISENQSEENLQTLCALVEQMEIPEKTPQKPDIPDIILPVELKVKYLIQLFGPSSSVVSHENFNLLSSDLQEKIYNFFIENKLNIPQKDWVTIMNFVLDGDIPDVVKKLEEVLTVNFCKKWVLWNSQIKYRFIDDFYQKDYRGAIQECSMEMFELFIEGYKKHGHVVFEMLEEIPQIKNVDLAARFIHQLIEKGYSGNHAKAILKILNGISDYILSEEYVLFVSEDEKNIFVEELINCIKKVLDTDCIFDINTFLVFIHAGYTIKELNIKNCFTPRTNKGIKKFHIPKELQKLKREYLSYYIGFRNTIYDFEYKVGMSLEDLKSSLILAKSEEDIQAKKIIDRHYDRKIFWSLLVRRQNIQKLNRLPLNIFKAFLGNPDTEFLLQQLKSGDIFLLERYFENPYFEKVISDTKDITNKRIFGYLISCAKKSEFPEMNEDFFDQEKLQDYFFEDIATEQILKWIGTDQKISKHILAIVQRFMGKTDFYTFEKISLKSPDGEIYKGKDAIFVIIRYILTNIDFMYNNKTSSLESGTLQEIYSFLQTVINRKDDILKNITPSNRRYFENGIRKAQENITQIDIYFEILQKAERRVLSLEKSDDDFQFKNKEDFLNITKDIFTKIYVAVVKKIGNSQEKVDQEILQGMNMMRDTLSKSFGEN